MTDQIFFDGKKYISAADAGSFGGFTRDYVARLCRDGKVSGRRVGKNWYADEASFRSFLVNQEYTKSVRNESLSKQRLEEYRPENAAPAQPRATTQAPVRAARAIAPVVSAAVAAPAFAKASAGAARANDIRERMTQALAKHGEKSLSGVRAFAATPAGISHAALQAVHVPIYTLTPMMEFAHKLIALTLTATLVLGTYAAVDPQNAKIALGEMRDQAFAVADSYDAFTGGGVGALADRTQQRVALAAEHPQVAAAGAASYLAGIPDIAAHLASAFNANVNKLVYAIAFPSSLTGSRGIAANSSRGSVSVSVSPYAQPHTVSSVLAATTPKTPATTSSGSVVTRTIIERVVTIPASSQLLAQSGGITEALLNAKLNQLDNKLSAQMFSLSSGASTVAAQNYAVTAQSNAIGRLVDVAIQNATISGGSIAGASINATDLSVDGSTSLQKTNITGSLTIKAAAGQSEDVLHVSDSTGATIFALSPDGTLTTVSASSTNFFSTLAHITTGVIDNFTSTLAGINGLTVTNSTTTNATTTNSYISNLTADTASTTNFLTTNATTTNLFSTTASSTNLFSQFATFGSTTIDTLTIGSGVTSNGGLTVNGNGYFSGGLGIGIATSAPGVIQTSGNAWFGGNLYVGGNSTVIGASSANTLSINSSINSNLIPDQNVTRDIGSTAFYWKNAYVGTLTANNISAASTTIGGTQSNTFTLNSDNATADAEDTTLIFFRGSVVPNALIAWNSAATAKRFEFNQSTYISNQSGSTTQPTLVLKGLSGQTGDLFQVASSSGATLFSVGSGGSIGIGTTTPWGKLSITGAGTGTGYTFVAADSNNLPLFNIQDNGNVGIGTTTPFGLFALSANNGNVYAGNNIFTIASSTASATTTLFSISNTGLITGLNFSLINGTTTNFFSTTASSTNLFTQYASTTALSVSGNSYFGSTGSGPATTIDSTGNLTVQATATISGGTNPASTILSLANLHGLTSGNGISNTASLSIGAPGGFTGSYINFSPTRTVSAAITNTDSGHFLNFNRLNKSTSGGTFNVTGDMATLVSTCTQAGGTCTDTSSILSLYQYANSSGSTGTVFNIQSGNPGSLATFVATSTLANGLAITLQSTSASQNILDLLNNGGSSVFRVNAAGNVGIGTTTPFGKLAINLNNLKTYPGNFAFNIASSTASATTTLFSISNTGATNIATSLAIGGATIGANALAVTGTTLFNSAAVFGGNAFVANGADIIGWNNATYGWSSAGSVSSVTTVRDTAISRISAGVVAFGTGAAGSTAGGFIAAASSTIGDGTQTGGLTISGGATTTGNLLAGTRLIVGSATGPALRGTAGGPMQVVTYDSSLYAELDASQFDLGISTGYYGFGDTRKIKRGVANNSIGIYGDPSVAATGQTSVLELHRPNTGAAYDNAAAFTLGNTTTGLGPASRLDLNLNQSNSAGQTDMTAMTWLASGNVGIGTSSPFATLSVTQGAGAAAAFVVTDSAGNIKTQISGTNTASNIFEVATSTGVPYFDITAGGQVGIGTTTPGTKLDIYNTSSGATADQMYLTNGASATSTASRLSFRAVDMTGVGTSTAAITSVLTQNFVTGKGDLVFSTLQSGSLTEVMRATSAGFLGIGTTTPYRRLSVTDQTANAQIALSYDASRVAEIRVDSTGDLNIEPSGQDVFLNNDNFWSCTGGSISVNGCPTGTPTGFGNIIAENKIGIGTSTPAAKLTIETQDNTTNFFQVASSTAQSLFVINANGNVGIGTSTPFAKLAVGAGGAIVTVENGLTDAATITVSWNDGNQQKVILGGNRTINFTNYIAGSALRLIICQDGTGSRTVTWDSAVIWPSHTAPTLTTTANECDIASFVATNGTSTLKVFGATAQAF